MKKLLIALLLITTSAQAEIYFAGKNAGGTDIILTLQKPEWCKGSYMMYTSTTKSEVFYGCWSYMQDAIHVVYADGERRVYNANLFEQRGKE